MPTLYLSPSTQEYNLYEGGGNEEEYMNLVADAMEPYLSASGIQFMRNNPDERVGAAIRQSNAGNYDLHLALHSNAAPESLAGALQGTDVYYSRGSANGQRAADAAFVRLCRHRAAGGTGKGGNSKPAGCP